VVSVKSNAEQRVKELGIKLPVAPTPFGSYVETVETGNLLFLSGMLPVDHKPMYVGRLGKELDAEAGREALRTAALSALAAAKKHLGSLDRVTRVVKVGVFIATSGDFFDQPAGCGCGIGFVSRFVWGGQDGGAAGDWRGQPAAGDAGGARGYFRGREIDRGGHAIEALGFSQLGRPRGNAYGRRGRQSGC